MKNTKLRIGKNTEVNDGIVWGQTPVNEKVILLKLRSILSKIEK